MFFFDKVMHILKYSLDSAPNQYNIYHMFWIIITIPACIFTFYIAKNSSEKRRNQFLLTVSLIMIILEIYKQLVYSYSSGTWQYKWQVLPFQFCSIPMYFTFIASRLKDSKLRDALYIFLATYTLLAGVGVMLYPNGVFVKTLGVNIQSMLHHIFMIIIGVYLWVSGSIKTETKSFINTFKLFCLVVSIALTLNLLIYDHVDGVFNMFFISPYYINPFIFGNWVQTNFGYLPFLILYITIFSFSSYLMLVINKKIYQFKTTELKQINYNQKNY